MNYQRFTAELLGEDNISEFLTLQDKVRAMLSDDQKHYLKPRTKDDLEQHLQNRMPMIGVRDEKGQLIGQCLVAYPFNEEGTTNLEGYPRYGNQSTVAIVQSLSVDPGCYGQNISNLILDSAADVAAQNGHALLIAKVADSNAKSQRSFLRAGFEQASRGMDATAGYAVTYYKRCLNQGCAAASQRVAFLPKVA